MVYTASFAFFEALWEYGITHVFVNLGSDHPSIIEAIVKGQNEKKGQFPRIITCPNEVCASIVERVYLADGLSRWSPSPWQTGTRAGLACLSVSLFMSTSEPKVSKLWTSCP